MLAAYGYKFVFDACKILIRGLRQSAMLERVIPLKHDIEEFERTVQKAAQCLQSGQVAAVPTDTIYGLACLAQMEQPVKDIYDIKGRDFQKALAICVADVVNISRWGKVTVDSAVLEQLLPGPVTVVFERTPELNVHLNPGTSLVGIRVPDHSFIREVSRRCGQPLALTSANLSGATSALTIQEFESLWPRLAIIVDGGVVGDSPNARLGSTVVDLSKQGYFTFIRDGCALDRVKDVLLQHGLSEQKKPS